MPVGQGTVGLDGRNDPHREMPLAHGGADERGNGSGRDAGELAEEGAIVGEVGPEPFGDSQHHLPVGDIRETQAVAACRLNLQAQCRHPANSRSAAQRRHIVCTKGDSVRTPPHLILYRKSPSSIV